MNSKDVGINRVDVLCIFCNEGDCSSVSLQGTYHNDCEAEFWEWCKERLDPKWGEWGCLVNYDPVKELEIYLNMLNG